jgi:hypothetical protein
MPLFKEEDKREATDKVTQRFPEGTLLCGNTFPLAFKHSYLHLVNGDFDGIFCILNRPSLHNAFLETQSSVGLNILIDPSLYVPGCRLCKRCGNY